MADKVPVLGPLTKGYDDTQPILNSTQVGGVLLENGLMVNRETKMLEIPYYGDNGDGTWSKKTKLLPLGSIVNPLSVIFKGLAGPNNVISANSQSSIDRATRDYTNKKATLADNGVMVNSIFSGARVVFNFTNLIIASNLKPQRYYTPWILLNESDVPEGYALNVRAVGQDESGEDDTVNWVKAGNPQNSPNGATNGQIWVRTLDFEYAENQNNPVFIFQSFKEG